jgi:superfamily II DNA or RNA helicase
MSLVLPRRQILLPSPRPYQSNLCAAANGALSTMQRTLAVSPTATGKTVCMLILAAEAIRAGHRVLIIVPAHLVGQTALRCREAQIRTDTEKGAHYALQSVDCVVASIDTLASQARLEQFDPENFGLVLVDEAHHAMAESWKRVIEYFEMAKVVGFTATPDRADGQKILEIFGDVCFEYTIKEAIRDQWLSPVAQEFVKVSGLDFTQVRKEARDLNSGDLDALMNNANMVKLMGDATARLCQGRQTVVFCVSVDHAYAYADYLRRLGCSATAVEGKTNKTERAMLEADFESGRIQYLCNVDCFSEGWDCPPVSGIVMARSTTSRALYAQQIGRGLRLYPGKRDCLVLDFVGNSGKHCLVHAAHVLDPDLTDRQANRAAELQQEDPELGVNEAIQLALDQLEEEDARSRLRREVGEGEQVTADFETVRVDPFEASDTSRVFELFALPRQDDRWGRSPSPPQLEALRRFGVKDPEVLSHREASGLLDELINRASTKRATLRQVRKLIQAGTHPENAKAMSFERAKRGLDELKANGWRRPESWGPRQTEPHPEVLAKADTS